MTQATPDTRTEELLARAMSTVDGLRAQLDRRKAAEREPIAVTGLGCRFPGADGPDAFAELLRRGDSVLAPAPQTRVDEGSAPRDPAYRQGGFFADVADFDAAAFGLDDAAALAMDPQLRLLLEVTRDAIDDAALSPATLARSQTAVILALGAQNADYANALMGAPTSGRAAITGSFHSLMPGQISYHFDLRGPSFVVDAACASSLVAVDLACRSLRQGECDRAIVAGVNLVLSDSVSRLVDSSGLWSQTGGSRSFAAGADGFVRGEGACVLVLARASDAATEGAPVRAHILGAACGQDGRGNGIAAPNAPAQVSVLRRAVAQARIDPAKVAYIEAHATGTQLGDAIEAEAVAEVYGSADGRTGPVVMGALKPTLGHLEAASGMAALARAVLACGAGQMPHAPDPATPSREIAALAHGIDVRARGGTWPGSAPYAGVSAFGMSGTNAHVILGPPPPALPPADDAPRMLRVTAPDDRRLRQFCARLIPALQATDDLPGFCASLTARARDDQAQLSVVVVDRAAALDVLRTVADGGSIPRHTGPATAPDMCRRLNLPPCPFERKRYWPDSMVPGGVQPEVGLRGMFRRPEWAAADVANAILPDAVTLGGNDDLRARIVPALRRLGVGVHAPASPSDAAGAGHLIYCVGAGFGDLASLRGLMARLADRGRKQRLSVVVEDGGGTNAIAAAAAGLLRAIGLEHPDLRARLVDLPKGVAVEDDALASGLFGETDAPVLRLEGDTLQAQGLIPAAFPAHSHTPDPNGTHLITGGFGGIGTVLATWLAERGARHILLLGRTPREHPRAAELRARGVTLTCVAADVSSHDRMARVFADAEASGHPVKSVFHAAGIESNALLAQQSPDAFAATFKAKLLGASVLDTLTRQRDLDAFVLFSSITAFLPLAGAGAYGAANASLGAIARARRAAGKPALCLYSGTWEGSGMLARADAELSGQWGAHGLGIMARAQALGGLEAAMGSGVAECVVAKIDWDKADQGRGQGADRMPAPASPVAAAHAGDGLEDQVRAAVAQVLGLAQTDARLSAPFADLGVSSLAAIGLRNELSTRLGLRLPATLAFNYPSVAALTQVLAARLNEKNGAPDD